MIKNQQKDRNKRKQTKGREIKSKKHNVEETNGGVNRYSGLNNRIREISEVT